MLSFYHLNLYLEGPATRSLVRRDNNCSAPFSIKKKKKSEIRKLDSVNAELAQKIEKAQARKSMSKTLEQVKKGKK